MAQAPYLALPGTPVHNLFRRNRGGRPPAVQQVMSPRRLAARMAEAGAQRAQPAAAPQANPGGFCPGADQVPLQPAMRFVHERMDFFQGEEEFWAERVLVEEQHNQEEANHIADVRARLAEEQFFYLFSHEAQQQARMWEHVEQRVYQAQVNNRVLQEAAQERLNMEAAVGQQFLASRQELQQAEEEHTHQLRLEARQFADGTRAELAEEVHHHQIAQAQAQSLLAAERQHHSAALEEQSTRWQEALDMVTAGAEEMHHEDVAEEEEAVRQSVFLWDEFMISQHRLEEWQRWFEDNAPNEEAEEELEIAMWNRGEEAEAATAEANAAKAPPPLPPPPPAQAVPIAPPVGVGAPAPITPVVLQNAPLNPRVLPPRNLPFDPKVLAEQRAQLQAQEERVGTEGRRSLSGTGARTRERTLRTGSA